jgi:hypothetical protein
MCLRATSSTLPSALIVMPIFHRRSSPPAQHDIESVPQRFPRQRGSPIKLRNQTPPRRFIRRAIKYRIKFQQRVTGKVHLRHQPRGKCRTKKRKMNMRRAPGVVMIAPWIFSGANGHEAILPFGIGDSVPLARKIGIQRRTALIVAVQISPRCIRLPNLHKRIWQRPAIFVDHPPADHDTRTDRSSHMLVGQIATAGEDIFFTPVRPGGFRKCLRYAHGRMRWRTANRGTIRGVQEIRLRPRGILAIAQHVTHCSGSHRRLRARSRFCAKPLRVIPQARSANAAESRVPGVFRDCEIMFRRCLYLLMRYRKKGESARLMTVGA